MPVAMTKQRGRYYNSSLRDSSDHEPTEEQLLFLRMLSFLVRSTSSWDGPGRRAGGATTGCKDSGRERDCVYM